MRKAFCCTGTLFRHSSDPSVQTEKIESAQADKSINDSRQPAHVPKEKGNKVKAEDADQKPVDRARDHKCQSGVIKPFHVISSFTVSIFSVFP